MFEIAFFLETKKYNTKNCIYIKYVNISSQMCK